ncbi:C4-dicarboxylate ABC transporter permease [Marinovum sp. 2_MG-2023]|uniref:TRAP transporter small permease subunit n=1 Tax=unclassified Marinovum TaxID=2647166 RepID=UPI0026E244F3|nr:MULTISPECIES: TRAP transporter small permease subunit [unclassified Marinovum]MDO6730394.1 C4-dicarboxylate ABC transporter permease [Marinovum sp. 2_MG-2023]MDO6778374.1 C4-dicarboxylate ABC transporter permease [Marinovum sp. 1_MG-2023]
MLDGLVWFFQNIALAFYNLGLAIVQPGVWLGWVDGLETTEDKQALMRFIYYGGSIEFFFAAFTVFLVIIAFGIWNNQFMWGVTRVLEGFANAIGRFFAWAGLLMVLQQIVIVFMQRIFAAAEISLGFGSVLSRDVSWWAEELKLYNAMIVALCATYTFVQGGHVRVDLVYSAVSFRTKRIIDMCGSMIFMLPAAVLTWMYGWFFLWRHLVVPKPSASDTLDRLITKARALRWNVETIGFSPNGFDAYFLFKVLLVAYAGLVFIHSWAFFCRSYLEFREGEASEHKYLDRDQLGSEEAELVHAIEEKH